MAGNASEADFAGLYATLNAEQTESLNQETKWLVAIFIPLAISLLFYTVGEGLDAAQRRLRLAMAIAGTLFLIGTISATIVVEFF